MTSPATARRTGRWRIVRSTVEKIAASRWLYRRDVRCPYAPRQQGGRPPGAGAYVEDPVVVVDLELLQHGEHGSWRRVGA
jgi:hypothetical protein